ncbi:AMP-binding protein [Streptomyces sp. NPDC005859]|uniref:AMP-binding protein n=1 Tax=Streptomyces sp. NPDC005859 TaxID=3157170 RepID=UPI0033F7724A
MSAKRSPISEHGRPLTQRQAKRAAPASAELTARFEARYGFPLVEAYGLSEGTCGSIINPVGGPRRAGTVELSFSGQGIRIIDADGTTRVQRHQTIS